MQNSIIYQLYYKEKVTKDGRYCKNGVQTWSTKDKRYCKDGV